jgi:DNA-binding winged helix-turn-helix (wHTH) protein/TolB-like protein/tetratricopeptide (TPR) repeat protein
MQRAFVAIKGMLIGMSHRLRFDSFELDVESGELRKSGRRIRLQPQPCKILLLLIERAGHVVSRDEIRQRLWSDSTFVDFEHAINFSINQLRLALGDQAAKPRYVETLPRRGYRFVGSVKHECVEKEIVAVAPTPAEDTVQPERRRPLFRWAFALGSLSLLALLVLTLIWHRRQEVHVETAKEISKKVVAVLPITNISEDPSLEWLGEGVADLLITDLAKGSTFEVVSRERVRSLLKSESGPGQSSAAAVEAATQSAGANIVLSGEIMKMGQGIRLNLRAKHSASGKILFVEAVEADVPAAIIAKVNEAAHRMASTLSHDDVSPTPPGSLTSSLEALRAYEEGLRYGERAMGKEAAASFRRAIEADPQFAMAYYHLAQVLTTYREKHELLERASLLADHQDLPAQHKLMIRAGQLTWEYRFDEAAQIYSTMANRFPSEPSARANLGGLLGALGRNEEAARELEGVVKLNDVTQKRVWNALAYTYAGMGRYSRAFDALDRYAALLPANDPNPIDTRGDLYAMGGNYQASADEYQKNFTAHPEFSYTRDKLALAFLLVGRNQDAERIAQIAYDKADPGDRFSSRNVQGDVALGRGDFSSAVKYFEQAAELAGPATATTYDAEFWRAAEIYFEQGEPEKAVELADGFSGYPANEVRGVADLVRHKDAEAEKEFALARQAMAPFMSDYLASSLILADRMRAASYCGQWQRVIELWEQLPDYPKQQSAFFAGRAYAELGLLREAEQQLQLSMRNAIPGLLVCFYSDFLGVELTQFYLGKVHERLGDKDVASTSYRAFLSHFDHSRARLPQLRVAQLYFVGRSHAIGI